MLTNFYWYIILFELSRRKAIDKAERNFGMEKKGRRKENVSKPRNSLSKPYNENVLAWAYFKKTTTVLAAEKS